MENIDNKIQEIISVITNELSCADHWVKKEINQRYNLSGSRKEAEIKRELLEIADTYRKQKKDNFTSNDYFVWNQLKGDPTAKNKMKIAIEGESEEWINYLLEYYKKWHEKTIGRFHEDKRYFTLQKILAENSPKAKKEENRVQLIYDRLTLLTFAFKEKMYNRFIESEKRRFEHFKKLDEELCNTPARIAYMKENPKGYAAYMLIYKKSYNFNWKRYKTYLDREFESMFTHNIKAIAQRINNNKKVNINHLKLKSITDDPKFFEIVLRDCGDYLIHCRSIIAAEYSEIVQTHYRFIVTVKHI